MFIVNKETKEVMEFCFNTRYYRNTEDALHSFSHCMVLLLPNLKGFKEEAVRQVIDDTVQNEMLMSIREQGQQIFSCDYDDQLTINILKDNLWFRKGQSFPSQFLINSTHFKAGDKQHNAEQHSKPQQNTQYIVSDSLHFITYPNGDQEIMYFD